MCFPRVFADFLACMCMHGRAHTCHIKEMHSCSYSAFFSHPELNFVKSFFSIYGEVICFLS